jgi:hypothetical protein
MVDSFLVGNRHSSVSAVGYYRPSARRCRIQPISFCALSNEYGAPVKSTAGPGQKSFIKRDISDSTSFWNSNVAILTSWTKNAPLKAVHSGKCVVLWAFPKND